MSAQSKSHWERQLDLNRKWAMAAFAGEAPHSFAEEWGERTQLSGERPFSFVYGGVASDKFLGGWHGTVVERRASEAAESFAVVYTDPNTLLEVRVDCTVYADCPGVDWTIRLTNKGGEPTPPIERLQALDISVAMPQTIAPVVHGLKGATAVAFTTDDWMPTQTVLDVCRRLEIKPLAGRGTQKNGAFFNVDTTAGGGLLLGIGWSGQWISAFERDDKRLRVTVGMEKLRLRLRPGESIRSPRMLHMLWTEQPGNPYFPYNCFRRTMLSHIVPRLDGQPIYPPIAHLTSSFYETNESTEEMMMGYLDSIKDVGFELFWLDAYWTKSGFPDGMGNYGLPLTIAEPADRFPHGIRPVGDAAHREGMEFILWFEPERVAPGTYIAEHHPEWVVWDTWSDPPAGTGMFNLGIPEAREYMTHYLVTAIEQYGMDWLRIDFNYNPLPFWEALDAAEPDRVGMAEIRYCEAVYRMWDEIRAAHPRVRIDNCAGGGQRIEIEMCARSTALWRTDGIIRPLLDGQLNEAANQNQVASAGLNRYLPFSTSGMMGTEPYYFRSAFNAGIPFSEDCRPDGYPREQLKAAIREGQSIRPYFAGDFYPLAPVSDSPAQWCVMQYDRPAEGDGIVLAFRREACADASLACRLYGIDPDADYLVSLAPSYEPPEPVRMSGAALRDLTVRIDSQPGSLLVRYGKMTG